MAKTREHMTTRWQSRIDQAQELITVEMDGGTYRRIRYGTDDPDAPDECRDCAVEIGQLHVPGCCIEACPRCGAQALGCTCWSPN